MKKIISVLAFAAAVFAGVSCTKTLPSDPVKDSKVTLSSSSLTLMETETAYLIATCYGDAKEEVVEWSTSDRAVATVSSEGKVTAKSAGQATIFATAGKWSGSCTLTVTAYDPAHVPVVKIAVDPQEVTIVETRTATITATYLPKDASDQPAFEWASTDEEVATVSAGVITAVSEGECEVVVKGENNHHASVKVTVIPDNKPTTKIELNKKEDFRLGKGFTEQLEVIFYPEDHTDLPTVTWTSSAPAVATVSANGLVTGVDAGEAEIIAAVGSLSAKVKVTVFAPMITKAWNSAEARAYPVLTNAGVLNNLSAFTMEAMVMATDYKASGSLSTVMGVEGNFLVRIGDAGIPSNRVQVATNNGNLAAPASFDLQPNRWYHIAVTYRYTSSSNRECCLYIDGQLAGSGRYGTGAKSFGMTHTNEASGTRCFWIGYAYDVNRDLRGGMCEVRIWNRVLTADEINATDHFYKVDPASEGLVAYWKMDDGQGSTMKDYTSNGNNLQGEVDIQKVSGAWTGTNGALWLDVALPE